MIVPIRCIGDDYNNTLEQFNITNEWDRMGKCGMDKLYYHQQGLKLGNFHTAHFPKLI